MPASAGLEQSHSHPGGAAGVNPSYTTGTTLSALCAINLYCTFRDLKHSLVAGQFDGQGDRHMLKPFVRQAFSTIWNAASSRMV